MGWGLFWKVNNIVQETKKIKGDCLCKVLSLGQMTEMINANEL